MDYLFKLSPVYLALLATLFTYAMTALGAGLVFFFKSINKTILNAMLGFASGVMIAASFWSLLDPSIELSKANGQNSWLVPAIGFLLGGAFLYFFDLTLPHLHLGEKVENAEGIKTGWQRSVLLVLAITLHNIPEGLAVGVAFGSIINKDPATLASAIALAIGIGIQNFPEGAAVSIPLRREGNSRLKSFFYGQISGLVEPIAGVVGAYLVVSMKSLLPYALAFAAGAMIYVVVEELIPEAQNGDGGHRTDVSTIGAMFGFVIMMILDVGLD